MSAGRLAGAARVPAWLGTAAAVLAVAGVACVVLARKPRPQPGPMRDYSGRSGFPGPPDAMRGRARGDFFADGAAATPAHLPDAPT